VRGEDIVARLGGDEFAIVQVPSENPPDKTALAMRLIEAVGASYDIDDHQVIVGASIGIAIAPGDGSEPDALMKNADLALYRAKADGGGVYRFFETAMDARMQARHALELDLRKAIVNGEFELYYQPIIDVKTRQVTSCEALVRWHHPERGMVPPLEFIPVAEATGLIVPLGEWVLQQACAEAARWPKHVTVAVNLSPAQFKSRNLVPTVISALAASGLPANRLELEITEMVLMQENDGAFVILHQLRDLGIRIAMDDFGTGYSSLGYLRSFPFDKIKIDQSFIRDLPGKLDSVAIVRAVVGLSSSLGITTIAEGVETKEQLASVTEEGCKEVQGYLYSWPKPAAEVQKYLAENAPRNEVVA
jgi:predicted signal transduction protein with EAL and GGDEF domain